MKMLKKDLMSYLDGVSRWASKSRNDALYHSGTDMTVKLDKWAIKAMDQYHGCKHHFIIKARVVGDSMEYFGVCRYCGEVEA